MGGAECAGREEGKGRREGEWESMKDGGGREGHREGDKAGRHEG